MTVTENNGTLLKGRHKLVLELRPVPPWEPTFLAKEAALLLLKNRQGSVLSVPNVNKQIKLISISRKLRSDLVEQIDAEFDLLENPVPVAVFVAGFMVLLALSLVYLISSKVYDIAEESPVALATGGLGLIAALAGGFYLWRRSSG